MKLSGGHCQQLWRTNVCVDRQQLMREMAGHQSRRRRHSGRSMHLQMTGAVVAADRFEAMDRVIA